MPNKIFDSDFLKKLENIALTIRMPVSEGASGVRKSKAKGSSVEFSDYREYCMGDDFRKIDWNAYGRFNKFFIKLFMEEREAIVNIFIDTSKSMDFGQIKKSETALKIAAVMTFLLLNNLDRVCINSMSGEILKSSKSVVGKNMFDRCINYLQDIEFNGSTNINSCIKRKKFLSKGLSIIISDFFMKDGIEDAVKYLLYKKQQIIFIHVLNEQELNPKLEGQVRLMDSETKEIRDIAVTSSILKAYEKQLKQFTSKLNEVCKKSGGQYVLINSSLPIEKIIFEELAQKGIVYGKS
ncbi:DUF58 domain-containing protein [Haloimpatiens sp. FM7330]|uniref:DUF58 domain-containing protein n=1 Tax=Haloimpatiens sp. FM7330 TaxID=3298610 RepID=UPI00364248F4